MRCTGRALHAQRQRRRPARVRRRAATGDAAVADAARRQARDWEGSRPAAAAAHVWVGDIGDNTAAWGTSASTGSREPGDLTTGTSRGRSTTCATPDGSRTTPSRCSSTRDRAGVRRDQGGHGRRASRRPRVLSTHAAERADAGARRRCRSRPTRRSRPTASTTSCAATSTRRSTRPRARASCIATVDLPAQPQGESIAWSPDGRRSSTRQRGDRLEGLPRRAASRGCGEPTRLAEHGRPVDRARATSSARPVGRHRRRPGPCARRCSGSPLASIVLIVPGDLDGAWLIASPATKPRRCGAPGCDASRTTSCSTT